MQKIQAAQVKKLIGKPVFAVRKDGSVVTGRLVRVHGQELRLQPLSKGKTVKTKAILPLVLYDLLAVGYYGGYGGYGPYGAPGYGAYGAYPYSPYGYPGYIW